MQNCGPWPKPVRVLATYRARAASAAASDGDAVAIELLPDDYTPPREQDKALGGAFGCR